jgi:hypothetical protein
VFVIDLVLTENASHVAPALIEYWYAVRGRPPEFDDARTVRRKPPARAARTEIVGLPGRFAVLLAALEKLTVVDQPCAAYVAFSATEPGSLATTVTAAVPVASVETL